MGCYFDPESAGSLVAMRNGIEDLGARLGVAVGCAALGAVVGFASAVAALFAFDAWFRRVLDAYCAA